MLHAMGLKLRKPCGEGRMGIVNHTRILSDDEEGRTIRVGIRIPKSSYSWDSRLVPCPGPTGFSVAIK